MSVILKKPQKEHYKFLFENASSGICLAAKNGSIIDCNEMFMQITGCDKIEEIYKENINNLFSNPHGQVFTFNNSTIENQNKQFYLQLNSKINGKKPCLVSIKQIEIQENNYIVIIVIDIGKQKLNQPKMPTNENEYQIEILKKRLFLSEEKFRKVLEISDSIVCIQNENKILYTNSAWEKLTGYSIDELNSNDILEYIDPEFKKLVLNRYRSQLQGKNVPEKYDVKILTKTGKELWVNAKHNVIDYEGSKALMIVFVDITKRKKAQQAIRESKKKFQSLFYENNSIMFVVDPRNGNIVDANEAACKFYGYSKAKIISLKINDVSAHTDEEINSQLKIAMEGKHKHFIFKHKLANNEVRDVEVYSGKVEIKETVLLYSVVHDITARKKAEEALLKSENKLKQLNAQKDKLFSIIAHDLRGPLGTFMQLTEYMKENYGELSDNEFENYFSHLYQSARGTFKLLENLLVWTRSQLGVLKIKPYNIDIHELTEETVSIYCESARTKELNIINKVDRSITAYADKNTIDAVIRNLISNAVKFTPKGGNIVIDAKMELNGKRNLVEISVTDTGVGISEERINKLFRIEENFSTFGTNNEKGTGLGLILCKDLVEKNGGELFVSSELGNGSTFTVSLPANVNDIKQESSDMEKLSELHDN